MRFLRLLAVTAAASASTLGAAVAAMAHGGGLETHFVGARLELTATEPRRVGEEPIVWESELFARSAGAWGRSCDFLGREHRSQFIQCSGASLAAYERFDARDLSLTNKLALEVVQVEPELFHVRPAQWKLPEGAPDLRPGTRAPWFDNFLAVDFRRGEQGTVRILGANPSQNAFARSSDEVGECYLPQRDGSWRSEEAPYCSDRSIPEAYARRTLMRGDEIYGFHIKMSDVVVKMLVADSFRSPYSVLFRFHQSLLFNLKLPDVSGSRPWLHSDQGMRMTWTPARKTYWRYALQDDGKHVGAVVEVTADPCAGVFIPGSAQDFECRLRRGPARFAPLPSPIIAKIVNGLMH